MSQPRLASAAKDVSDDEPRSTRALRTLEIATEHDRFWASREARQVAAALGFGADGQARIALCVAELASNIVRHAGRGRIVLIEVSKASANAWRGCRVRAEDEGPGLLRPEEALRDGFSEGRWLTPDVPVAERRGLGVGLGTVCRLMSDVQVLPRPGGGLRIEATLWHAPERSWNDEVETCRKR